jgi:hypothetical protein
MDTEALQPSEAAFNATHHPLDMFRRLVVHGHGSTEERETAELYSERRFIDEVTADGPDWMFVPVIGSAGSGKSHLVRWLSTRLPVKANRRVLLIPRTDTNLRDILERILGLCDGPVFDSYRDRLREATDGLTPAQARTRLLNHLAEYVGPQFHSEEEPLEREYRYLVRRLPAFLYDPFVREHLLRDGGFLHRLTDHILGSNTQVERLLERRQITVEDLPLDLTNIARASEQARSFYACLLGQPAVQSQTVEWINRNLNEAIVEMLRFRGEDLRQLMRSVRETLAESGTELFLLIEDFARLQGIDLQLLESLLERPRQPGRANMCALRSVIAVNTDYYLKLPDTARQRASFHVDLDVPKDLSAEATRKMAVRFTSAYLNAVRLPPADLAQWFAEHRDDDIAPPSACAECIERDRCHAGFGADSGYGLYPFNRGALVRLLTGVSEGSDFNPRHLVKDVLRHVLDNYSAHIQEGRFPARGLLDDFGGSHLPARLTRDFEVADPVDGDRRRVLLEVWGEDVKERGVHDLDPAIHEAFQIPMLGRGLGTQRPTGPGPIVPTPPPPPAPTEDPLRPWLDPLEAWLNGRSSMPQQVQNKLRQLIYPAVKEYIAWDREMLVQERVASPTALFQPRSIHFEDSGVEAARVSVRLPLPVPGETRAQVALALEALLRFDRNKGWNFPGAADAFLAYTEALDRWAAHVVAQCYKPAPALTQEWDPVPAIAESLAVAGRLCGTSMAAEVSLAEEIDLLLTPQESADDGLAMTRHASWARLTAACRAHAPSLRELLLARSGCVKGGSKNVITLDASRIVPTLKRFRASLLPGEDLPGGLDGPLSSLATLRRSFDQELQGAITDEAQNWLQWDEHFGGELRQAESCAKFVARIQDFGERAAHAGLIPGRLREALEIAVERFRPQETDRLLRTLDQLTTASGHRERMAIVSLNYLPVMSRAQTLIEAARQFVAGVAGRAENERENFRVDAGLLQSEVTRIHDLAQAGIHALQQLGGTC